MNLHEQYTETEPPRTSSDRSFGIVFAVFFTLLALLPLRHAGQPRWWAAALALLCMALACLWPAALHPANRAWTQLAKLLNKLTNPLVTGLLFWAVFTPFALVLRCLKKDLLQLRPEPRISTYWIDRSPPGPDPKSMENQF